MADTYGWRIASRMRQHRNEVAKWICSSRKCATCTGNSGDGELHSQLCLLCPVTYRKKFSGHAIRRINWLRPVISNFPYAYGGFGSSYGQSSSPILHHHVYIYIYITVISSVYISVRIKKKGKYYKNTFVSSDHKACHFTYFEQIFLQFIQHRSNDIRNTLILDIIHSLRQQLL